MVINSLNVQGAPGVSSQVVHEQRFGKKNQIEISVPIEFTRAQPGLWYGGLGDVGVGLKRVVFSSLRSGTILSFLGEAVVPTGSTAHGLGTGTTVFETHALFGQLFPHKFFVQGRWGRNCPLTPKRLRRPFSYTLPPASGSTRTAAWGGCGRRWWNSWQIATWKPARRRIST